MPVRIRIADVLAGIPFVSVITAAVTIRGAEARDRGGWLLRQRFAVADIVPRPQDAEYGLCALPTITCNAQSCLGRNGGSFEKEIHS